MISIYNLLNKYGFLILLVLLIGCKKKKESEVDFVQNKTDLQIETVKEPMITSVKSKKTESQLPEWLTKMYLEGEGSDIHKYTQLSFEIEKFKQVNDSLTFCMYSENEITCTRSFLATQLNRVEIDHIEIAESCDRDLSFPSYSWSEYKAINDNTFRKTEYSEFVPASVLSDNGKMEEGKNMEDYETERKAIHYEIKILESGKIKKTKDNNTVQ